MKSRVKRDFHARFRENVGVKFPCVTRLWASLRATVPLRQLDRKTMKTMTKKIFSRQTREPPKFYFDTS